MHAKIRLIGFTGVVVMSGWGGLGGYIEDLADRRARAGDPNDTSPDTNATRRACDWAARKGGIVAGAPHVQYACGPYWDEQDDYVPPEPSGVELPFEGGQCAGTIYTVSTIRGDDTGLFRPQITGLVGPITSISYEREPIENEPTRTFVRMDVTAANGSFFDSIIYLHAPDSPPSTSPDVAATSGPDDCGDPEPVGTNPGPVNVPPTILPPDGEPVPIDDPNNPTGVPPIRFPSEPTPYDPWLPIVNPPPGWPPFILPPSPGDDVPPRIGEPVDVPSGGTGSEDIETPEDDLPDECIGYAWEFHDIPANRGGIPGAEPSRFYEIFGSAQLRVSSRDGAVYDTPVKIDSARGVCYRSDKNLRVRGLSLNSKISFGPVRVRPVYVVVREGQ